MSKKNKIKKNKIRAVASQPSPIIKAKETTPRKPSRLDFFLKPQNIFIGLAFIFGTVFLITTPPFQVADEIAHFDRAYKLSEFATFQKIGKNASGDTVSGDYVPASIDSTFRMFRYLSWKPDNKVEKQKILDALKIPLEKKKRKFTNIDAGPYFYFSYIPQYPAIYLGKIFNLTTLTILYLGRFFALLFYILCVSYAIRIIPTTKFLLMTIALMPMCLAQAGSSNADCVLFSFSFLAIALLLKISFEQQKLTVNKDSILLFFILLILGVMKLVYWPMAILIFIIPKIKFKNILRYYTIAISVILLSAVLTILWVKATSITHIFGDTATNSSEKIQQLIHNPFISLKLVKATLNYLHDLYYYETIGILGYIDTKLPEWVYTLFLLTIIILTLFEANKSFKLSWFQRILFFIIGSLVFLGAVASIYLINPKENGYVVLGVQGRYFIPMVFPFLLAFNGLIPLRFNLAKYRIAAILLIVILFCSLLGTQTALMERYYG